MRQQIIAAIKQYSKDNGLTFERHAFINDLDTVNDTCVGVYSTHGDNIIHMLQCVEKTVLGSSPDANLRADFYTLIQHRTKTVSPGTVLVYFPLLKGKLCNTSAFDGSVSVNYGIPITEQDKVFRNALERYIRRFSKAFPLFEFTGSMTDAIQCINECLRKGQSYAEPLFDKHGNPILYQQSRR